MREIAIFGGGCFWCTEAVFKMLRGVSGVQPGYVDGIEVIELEYDPKQISYRDLLTVFFGSHDPTSLDRQMYDVGREYRSVIFYLTSSQRAEAMQFIAELNNSAKLGDPVVTEVAPLTNFHLAEEYHQDFYAKNPNLGYCQVIINPKLEKVQKEFANLLDDKSKHGN